ncbi:MAG: AmmeMemoRadiSam system radical SAM enzyme [bacterium]|nr:AmmeMemoRadiSam system radical SAM enzyme [bacterium]
MANTENMELIRSSLSRFTREGALYETLEGEKIRCFACGHRCVIPEGRPGVCRVRYNEDGRLMVPFGYTAGVQCDPIEKKPFFHAMPGTNALSFGMLGCDLHCAYCQNWVTSQTLRDADASGRMVPMTAEEIVDLAVRTGASTVTSTYNEPLITAEWSMEVFRLARERGLKTSYVSNGNGTPEVIDYIEPWTDLYKVDLKSFQDKNYRKLGGTLQAVLDTIQRLHERGFWVEIVTLVIPSFNDGDEELGKIARFIASVDPAIPWHVTAFHEDYKMSGMGATQARTLIRAAERGREAGLKFVYLGNLPGRVEGWENTNCHACDAMLIERTGFHVHQNRLTKGRCPDCGEAIPGVWT